MANKGIDKQLDEIDQSDTDEAVEEQAYTKVYQVYPNSKIPVSKALGKFWENRQKEGSAAIKQSGTIDRWDESIRYYQNDQGGQSNRKGRLDEVGTGAANEKKYATENIVFANISALVPSVYAKNPDIEVNFDDADQEAKAKLYEALVEALFFNKVAPGINLKPKMRKATILAMLTNLSYLELSFTKKEDSSETVMAEIMTLSEELEKAKNIREIAEIEGKLQALDNKINLLSSSGPKLRVRPPHAVIVDPNSEDVDGMDSSFMIIEDYIRTEFLRAIYGNKDDGGNWKSIYAPTHVLKASNTGTDIAGHDEEINNFTLLDNESDYQKFGYKSESAYKSAQRTKVWMVWDKTTRRVLMFHDTDWSMPIWVWDDPYGMTRFFPYYALAFYTDPVSRYARSEVMYYLDQQDEINTINNERARMRHWIMSKVFVNTAVIKDINVVTNFLSGKSKDLVQGIELPEGVKISDAISTLPSPSTQFEGLFTTDILMQSVNRISSVTPVLQNEQFKTNTTNKAIESYESSTQTRLDEKIDAIEDVLADIGVGLIEMCIQFMDADQVEALVGKKILDAAGGWEKMTPAQFHTQFQFKIVGGSTLKPTSKVKKEQALQLGQVLGQFAQAAPATVLIMLKNMERAFNEDMTITDDEWKMLTDSVKQALAGPAPSANGGGKPPTQGGQAAPPTQGQGDPMAQGAEALSQIIDALPPEAKAHVGELLAQGVPLKEIIATLTAPQENANG